MTYQLIETKTLGTAAASIEFTSIPQTFTDLVAVASLRGARASVLEVVRLEFNGITTAYSRRTLFGEDTQVGSETQTDRTFASISAANATANTFGSSTVYIPNYTGSTNKSFSIDSVAENNGALNSIFLTASLFSNIAAITSMNFTAINANLVAGSTISLYGILKGSDGIVTTS